jgi:hypothetical protein
MRRAHVTATSSPATVTCPRRSFPPLSLRWSNPSIRLPPLPPMSMILKQKMPTLRRGRTEAMTPVTRSLPANSISAQAPNARRAQARAEGLARGHVQTVPRAVRL